MADEGYWGKSPEEVLSQLVDIYQSDLLRLCFMVLHDRTMAEDAVQETFIKAYRNLSSFRGECSVKTWLTRIAVNTCRDMRRAAWFRFVDRRISQEEMEALVQDARDDDESSLLAGAILRLPVKQREVVLLYYDQGMTMSEISQTLGISVSSVYGRLKHAYASLRRALSKEEL